MYLYAVYEKRKHNVRKFNREWSVNFANQGSMSEVFSNARRQFDTFGSVAAKKRGSSFTNGQQSLADATAQTAHSSSVRLLPPRPTYIASRSFPFLFFIGVVLILAS